jgi:hypothetical protein
MIGWIVRLLLAASASITAIFVSHDADNFTVVQGMVGVALFAAIVLAMALWSRR